MKELAAAVLVLLASGCGAESLADEDPNGYRACMALIRGLSATTAENRTESMLAAGQAGRSSSSEDIRSAVKEAAPLSGLALPEPGKLREACEAHGVFVPDRQTERP
jgi:hypothetical protein